MTEETERRTRDPRPRNEPTEPAEVRGSPRSGPTGSQSTQATTQQQRGGASSGGYGSNPGTPRSGREKVGTAATPRTGATTGPGSSTRSNAETRGGSRNAGDE